MVLPGGTDGPKWRLVRLEPIAMMTSAFFMKSANIFERERVEPPSDSGWLSAMALLPGLVATTGAGSSSASAASCVAGLRVVHALAGPQQRVLGREQHLARLS